MSGTLLSWAEIGLETNPSVYVASNRSGIWLMNGDELEAVCIPVDALRPVIAALQKRWREGACPECNGSGDIDIERGGTYIRCPKCMGSGRNEDSLNR